MKLSKLKDGTPMLVFKINSFVKASDYATALTDYFYRNSLDFNKKITRKEAKDILYDALFLNGLQGEYEYGFFEASYELGEIYNKIYSDAFDWVIKNYPYLLTP